MQQDRDEQRPYGGLVEQSGQPSVPEEASPPSVPRRDFIRKAGQVGLSAGLAHFLLVGGRPQKAFAVADECPDTAPSTDTCYPSQGNPDKCQRPKSDFQGESDQDTCDETDPDDCYSEQQGLAESSDRCDQSRPDNHDECWLSTDKNGQKYDDDDACPGTIPEDRDSCFVVADVTDVGDQCGTEATAPDECLVDDSVPAEVGDVCDSVASAPDACAVNESIPAESGDACGDFVKAPDECPLNVEKRTEAGDVCGATDVDECDVDDSVPREIGDMCGADSRDECAVFPGFPGRTPAEDGDNCSVAPTWTDRCTLYASRYWNDECSVSGDEDMCTLQPPQSDN